MVYVQGKHRCWKAQYHADGSSYSGYFIAGIDLPGGTVTYHIPDRYWFKIRGNAMERAPEWDGHTPDDVVKRLTQFLEEMKDG